MVEHNLAKVGVASSNLVSRSNSTKKADFGRLFLCLTVGHRCPPGKRVSLHSPHPCGSPFGPLSHLPVLRGISASCTSQPSAVHQFAGSKLAQRSCRQVSPRDGAYEIGVPADLSRSRLSVGRDKRSASAGIPLAVPPPSRRTFKSAKLPVLCGTQCNPNTLARSFS